MCNVVKFHGVRPNDPYADAIHAFMVEEFPGTVEGTQEHRLDAITSALIGTGQVRLGPQPSIDSQYAMRRTIEHYQEANQPIPVLIPSGPKKPVSGKSIDIAELFAMKTLAALNARILPHHAPGLRIYVRLEDLTGYELEGWEPKLGEDMAQYTSDFAKLVKVLGYDFIVPMLESTMSTREAFRSMSETIYQPMSQYVKDSRVKGIDARESIPAWHDLVALGWTGIIPQEQRDYYFDRYRRIYPDFPQDRIEDLMVRYLATTLARIKIGALGMPEGITDYLQLSFVLPIPGAPKGLTAKRVYYRTMPLKLAKGHVPYWRAKGYFKMNEEGVKPSLTNWHEPLDYNPFAIELSGNGETVNVDGDYVIEG
jgi:hypothetical protein